MAALPFISFEGIDGCGKSTQINLLKQWFETRGIATVLTREPGGCDTAEQIRELVLSPETNVGSTGELLLYLAARAEHVRQVITLALENGSCVITDRFFDSTFAYQGYGRGLDLEEMQLVNRVATGGVSPDITFLLDIDVAEGRRRVIDGRESLDRLEQSSLDFFERVRQGYLSLAKEDADRFVVIDATESIESIHEKICETITPLLNI